MEGGTGDRVRVQLGRLQLEWDPEQDRWSGLQDRQTGWWLIGPGSPTGVANGTELHRPGGVQATSVPRPSSVPYPTSSLPPSGGVQPANRSQAANPLAHALVELTARDEQGRMHYWYPVARGAAPTARVEQGVNGPEWWLVWPQVVEPAEGDRDGGGDADGQRTWPVEVQVRVVASAACPGPGIPPEGTVWTVTVHNQTPLTIVEVLFPCIRGADWGGVDECLFYPHHAGERIPSPRQTLCSERYRAFGRAASFVDQQGRYAREINYCGLASMMWMDYTSAQGGFYVASYDPEFLLTGLRVEVDGTNHHTGGDNAVNPWRLGLAIRKYVPIRPGQEWCSPPVILAFHDGDWHTAAGWYREWFTQSPGWGRQAAALPSDLATESVVTPWYDLRRAEGVLHRFDELPAIYDDLAERWRSRHLFLAGWNRGGFDSQYPEYSPDMELGTAWQLLAAVQHVSRQGGFVTFYINSRLFDRNSFYYPTLGHAWMIRDTHGAIHQEQYGPAEFGVCCPAHAAWQQHLRHCAQWQVQAYGARGIYYDQLGSAEPFPCYAPEHSHREADGQLHHGLYNQGYVQLLEETSRALTRLRPDSFLMIENCGDLYSSRVWASLVWNGTLYDEFFRLFKYTFPQLNLVQMIQPRTAVTNVEEKRLLFERDLAEAWLLGSIFWVHAPRLERPSGVSPEEAERMVGLAQGVLALRRAVAAHLARTRFVDTDDLAVLDQAANSAVPDPGEAWSGRGHESSVPPRPQRATHWVGQDEASRPVHLVLVAPTRERLAVRVQKGDRPNNQQESATGCAGEQAATRWAWWCWQWQPPAGLQVAGEAVVQQKSGEELVGPDGWLVLPASLPGVWQAWWLAPAEAFGPEWIKEG
ncbi:MAG: hypothetical protein IMX01_06770 [Limnochordaceae bacterium]|nr:hypothetical protein [Limnochordaceae bacterium]